jgi:uncharacterized membrane protein HdeD (DUF308 family)
MIISGLVFTVTGVYCFIKLGSPWASVSFVPGIVMIVTGVSNSLSWLVSRRSKGAAGWVFSSGLLSAVLGILVLLYPFPTDLTVTIVFGMWTLITGIHWLISAIERKGFGRHRFVVGIAGLLAVCVGLFGFVYPLFLTLALTAVLGIIFIMRGVGDIVAGLAMSGGRL